MADGGKFHILIVDDDAFILNMYVAKFSKEGHTIDTARSGEEVITKLREGTPPDAVLLDVVLPGMDGLEALAQIRKDNIAPATTKFIMLTNQGAEEEMEKAKSLGVVGYVVKAELTPSEVVSKVLSIIEGSHK